MFSISQIKANHWPSVVSSYHIGESLGVEHRDRPSEVVNNGHPIPVGAVAGLEEASVSAMSKLEQVLPARLRTRLEDISTSTVSIQTTSASSVSHRVLSVVAATIRKVQRLRFEYTDGSGRASERHVEPIRLVHTGRRWYLVAFDLDRNDWRTFRMDRVVDARNTLISAEQRSAPDPAEFVQRGIGVEAWSIRATVLLRVPLGTAKSNIHPAMGSIEAIDHSSCRITIGADDTNWIARFLLGLPFGFEVEQPQELIQELASIGSRLVTAYE